MLPVPFQFFIDPTATRLKAVDGGMLFLGKEGLDPYISANRISIYYIDENGVKQETANPVHLNKSGVPVFGTPETVFNPFVSASVASLKVVNKYGDVKIYEKRQKFLTDTRRDMAAQLGLSYEGEWYPNIDIPVLAQRSDGYALWSSDANGGKGCFVVPAIDTAFTTSSTYAQDVISGFWIGASISDSTTPIKTTLNASTFTGVVLGTYVMLSDRAFSLYQYVTGETANGYSIISHASLANVQLKFVDTEFTSPDCFGAAGDGVTDDTDVVKWTLTYCESTYQFMRAPKTYYITDNLYPNNIMGIIGGGAYYNNNANKTKSATFILNDNISIIIGSEPNHANSVPQLFEKIILAPKNPLVAGHAAIIVGIVNTGTQLKLAGGTIQDVTITEFDVGVRYDTAWQSRLINAEIRYCNRGVQYNMSGVGGSGGNLTIDNSSITYNRVFGVDVLGGTNDGMYISISKTDLAGNDVSFNLNVTVNAAYVYMSQVNIHDDDTGCIITNGGTLELHGCTCTGILGNPHTDFLNATNSTITFFGGKYIGSITQSNSIINNYGTQTTNSFINAYSSVGLSSKTTIPMLQEYTSKIVDNTYTLPATVNSFVAMNSLETNTRGYIIGFAEITLTNIGTGETVGVFLQSTFDDGTILQTSPMQRSTNGNFELNTNNIKKHNGKIVRLDVVVGSYNKNNSTASIRAEVQSFTNISRINE